MNTAKKSFLYLLLAAAGMSLVHPLSVRGSLTDTTAKPVSGVRIPHAAGRPIDLANVPGDEAAHHVITEAGSYYLSGDLKVTRPTGINVQCAGVTINLNGFEIRRATGSGGHGILIALLADECTVKNGSVTGFGYGVRSFSEGGTFHRLEASHCGYAGLVGGSRWLIDDCRVQNNGGIDILTGDGSRVVTRLAPGKPARTSGPVASPGVLRKRSTRL